MIEIQGKYNKAKIMTDVVDDTTMSQIYNLLNQEFTKDSQIRFMPDLHAGKGCVIGTTMDIKDKVCPNIVGVDIGCGVKVVELGKVDIDYEALDKFIRDNIPSGFDVNSDLWSSINKEMFDKANAVLTRMTCKDSLSNTDRLVKSMCTLGGGNHFIEINEDTEGNKYLLVHTGSRNLGKQVAEIYQEKAIKYHKEKICCEKQDIIENCQPKERQQELSKVVMPPKDLCYLEGLGALLYLADMSLCQDFALLNRYYICMKICSFLGLNLENLKTFESVHNYIDSGLMLRKGAISAKNGERVIIPINMRDGAIIGIGQGNQDYNYSAPHGAGRIMSRSEAKQTVSMEEFKESMQGIFSTSVCESTIDESPMAYKDIDYVLEYIKGTVEVEKIIKPVYNFKAS